MLHRIIFVTFHTIVYTIIPAYTIISHDYLHYYNCVHGNIFVTFNTIMYIICIYTSIFVAFHTIIYIVCIYTSIFVTLHTIIYAHWKQSALAVRGPCLRIVFVTSDR